MASPLAGQLQRMQPALVIAKAQSDLFYFALLFINIWKFGGIHLSDRGRD